MFLHRPHRNSQLPGDFLIGQAVIQKDPDFLGQPFLRLVQHPSTPASADLERESGPSQVPTLMWPISAFLPPIEPQIFSPVKLVAARKTGAHIIRDRCSANWTVFHHQGHSGLDASSYE